MMRPGEYLLQTLEEGNGGSTSKRIPCPLYGCKRMYTDTNALESHVKDHAISTQSLPGKTFLCSSAGCGGSFSSMQKLMEHMRHHYKPNIYFQCESCRTKLRSYKGLLAHLHTCSKVTRAKPKPAEPSAPQPPAVAGSNMAELQPPHLESVSSSPQVLQVPNPDGLLPAAGVPQGSLEPPVLGPPIMPLPETPPSLPNASALTEAALLPPLKSDESDPSFTVKPAALQPAADPFEVPNQQQSQIRPAGSVLCVSPGSTAVWKKNQGAACNRRVLWEHTRGRYTCVQCGQISTNRKDMNQHISAFHSGAKPVEGATGSVAKPPL